MINTDPPARRTASGAPTSIPWEESTGDEKRCWICFLEEGEDRDGKPPGAWIRPCKCRNSLKYAHEDCLLRWITEKQGPLAREVRCPACGHTYAIDEANDMVLQALEFADQTLQQAVPYATLAGVGMAFYIVATTYGAFAVMTMCGADLGERILSEVNWGWRTWVGLPVIPVALVSARMTTADAALPLLPFLVLGNEHIRLGFPPSPALTVCILPWARLVYNALWEKLGPWLERMVAPRATTLNLTAAEERDEVLRIAAENEEDEGDFSIARRDGQRLVMGSLFLP
ncbi:hypothetical protein HKX48_006460, partial [Thoreauomyces humboldtii]